MINKEVERTLENLRIAAHQHVDERNYWLQKLSGEWVKSHFPYDKNIKNDRLENNEDAEPFVFFEFEKMLSQRLITFSNGSDTRLFMILLTGLYLLLHRYSGEADLVVGLPVYKQDNEERLINRVLALRNNLNSNMSVKQLLMQVRASLGEALDHYGYPIELLPELLNLPFSEEEFPLFDVAILLENIHNKNIIRDIKIKTTYCFTHNENGITVRVEYDRNYYGSTAVRSFINHFQQVLQSAFQDAETPIRCIDIVPGKEKQQLLFDFNNNKGVFSREKTIFHFVEKFAQESPDRIALAGTVESLTYQELNRRANRLAECLRLNGITEDQLVGIFLDRSALMLIAVLAIWKAGGAYIPMDTNFPQQRIQEILKDSNAPVLLLESQYMEAGMFQNFESKVIVIESLFEEDRYTFEKHNQNLPFNMFSLSYVIYTSGSMGKPKGVMVEHIGMMNHIQAKINDLQITGESIIAQNASHTFDISVWQFFAAMIAGGKTVIYPEEYILEPHLFVPRLINDRISILEVVPSYLSILLNQLDTEVSIEIPLKYLLVTGEEVKPQLIKQWLYHFAHIPVINAYGPTEASDDITHFLIKEAPDVNQISIGKPVLNFNIYILDKNMNLCPIGVKGEICVSGVGVGRGYLNDLEKTHTAFMKDPFAQDKALKLYKTGDLGCWLPDGNIDFFGRIDHQVKIRGFRIELGEIEAKILDFEGIKETVVIDRKDNNGQTDLCAYCVVNGRWNIALLKEFLHSQLPSYMVPLHFIRLERLPLSYNGKIDRNALPEPASAVNNMAYISANELSKIKVSTAERKKDSDAFFEYQEPEVLLSAEEKEKILRVFNDTKATFPDDRVIQQLLEEQAARTSDRTALVFNQQHLSYSRMNAAANKLARHLRIRDVKPGEIIGLMANRSLEMMIGIFAILKAGGAFMPIDHESPETRIKYMLEEADSRLLLSDKEVEISIANLHIIYLHIQDDPDDNAVNSNLPVGNTPNDISHVLFTSGTTGKPKGVLLEHRSIINLMEYVGGLVSFREEDNIISLTPITFDVFTEESILPLTKGSKVTLGSQDVLMNYRLEAAMIVQHAITIVHSAPSLMQRFITDSETAVSLKGLRLLMLAGEPLLENLLQHLRQLVGGSIFNLYGPTETTIYSSARDVTAPDSLSIGNPIANTGIYILGKNDCLQPVGMIGELCIGGLGVARGYLNRPELTEEKFIHFHHSSFIIPHSKLYRTGDLARWLPTGDIEYIGRIDHQFKLGGVRIEPGEIENSLMIHPDISEAAVVVKIKNDKEYLCAYLVANEPLIELEIRAWISVELPLYMIPALFVQLEKMPITPNGKVDRKLLAGLEISRQSNARYIAPADDCEEKLVEIWAEILELPIYGISMEANFFELGGHSLRAISIMARIHKIFNVRVPLLELFKTPSVRGIAGFIKKAKQDKFYFIEEVEKKDYYILSSAQKRLYILQQMELASTVYNMPEIIPLTIIPDLEKFQNTFIRLIKRHESLRTSFHLVNDEPVQRVHDGVDFEISYYQLNADDRERMKVVNIFDRAFDLSQAPLLKVGVVKTVEAQYFLVVVMHHIISDGVSHQVLVNDFMTLFADDRDDVLPPLRIQYKDFSQWQNSQQEKNRIKSQETYWLKEFEGAIPVLNLPTDFNRPDVQLFKGSGLNGAISIDTEKLRAIARENGATTFIVMLTIFYIFLYKMTGQEDIVIGTPVSGRRHADLEKIIGMFVNSLPLRNRPVGEKSFIDFLQEVRLNTLAAFENQEYQFEDLAEKLSVKRDRHNPIFDVMFTCQEQDIEERVDAEKKEEIYSSPSEQKPYEHADFRTSKFDFTLNIVIAKKLLFSFEYSPELFKKKTIEIFADGLKEIVLAIMPNKNIKLKDINITTFLADADNSKIQEELSGMEF